MWPWEHLAVGYLCYSALTRYWSGEPPTAAAAIAVSVGTQFPDVVDKPLGWIFAVFEGGVSVAHSIFTTIALSAVVVTLSGRLGRARVGAAFAVGYLSHLPTDAVYGLLFNGRIKLRPFLWPLVDSMPSASSGLLDNVGFYALRFLLFLTTDRGLVFLSIEVLLLAVTAWVWTRDGCPGFPRRDADADRWRSDPPL